MILKMSNNNNNSNKNYEKSYQCNNINKYMIINII